MAQPDVCLILTVPRTDDSPVAPPSVRLLEIGDEPGAAAEHAATIGRPDLAIVVDPFTDAGEAAVLLAGWAAERVWFVVTQPPRSRLGIDLQMHRIAERIVLTDVALAGHLPNGTPVDVTGAGRALDAVVDALVREALSS